MKNIQKGNTVEITFYGNDIDDDIIEWAEEQGVNELVVEDVCYEDYRVWIKDCPFSVSIDNISVIEKSA